MTEAMTEQMRDDPLDGNTVRWFATGLLRHELSHPEQERAAELLMRLYDRLETGRAPEGKGNELADSTSAPVAPPLAYSELLTEAANYISVSVEFDGPIGRAAPDARARTFPVALRALAALIKQSEQVDWTDAQGWPDELLSRLAAGFIIPSGAVGK